MASSRLVMPRRADQSAARSRLDRGSGCELPDRACAVIGLIDTFSLGPLREKETTRAGIYETVLSLSVSITGSAKIRFTTLIERDQRFDICFKSVVLCCV